MLMMRRLATGIALVTVSVAVACSGDGDLETGGVYPPVEVPGGTPVVTTGLPPAVLLPWSLPTDGGTPPHFTVVAGEAVVDGDQVRVTFELQGVPPTDEEDLMTYDVVLHFEGHDPGTQAPVIISGDSLANAAVLRVYNANPDSPARPELLRATLERDAAPRTVTLSTRFPAGWPDVAAAYARVSRSSVTGDAIELGPLFHLQVRDGDLSEDALTAPPDIPFPVSTDASSFPVRLSLPATWGYSGVRSTWLDARNPEGSAYAGVGIAPGIDAEALLVLVVEESDGAYALELPDGGAIGPFGTSIVVRAMRDYEVAAGASEVFPDGWFSTAGNILLLAAGTHDGVTYLAYVEVPAGGDPDEWRSILEDATFR